MGSHRVGHDWATSLSLFTFMHWRRRWQPTPVFLPGESQGRGEPGGLLSTGSHRVGHDWSDLAAAAAAERLVYSKVKGESEVTQSCPTLCDPMDRSLRGSSIHGIFQARVLKWVVISFSRGSSPPRDRTPVSRTANRRFYRLSPQGSSRYILKAQ